MRLFRNPALPDGDLQQMQKQVVEAHDRLQLLNEVIQALFLFLREYTLDISEIDADKFKTDIRRIQETFNPDVRARVIESRFEGAKSGILAHIQRQKTYLEERETEFREIIDLMTTAMTGMDRGNNDFYNSIRVQGERFEAITLLDDIKRIKNELMREVENMRDMVRQKESRDQSTLTVLTRQVESLKNELAKARHSACTDSLTGVHNRKALDDYLRRLIERNTVTRTPFSILMMDLDDFKRLNDTYGHTVGDRMLLAFARKCMGVVRSDDFLSRYGGEEFTLVLPGASLRNATKKARHLCRIIAGTKYAADDSATADAVSVTVSIGVSCYRKGDTLKTLIERADRCLYQAKAKGKNRAVAENRL